MGLIDRIFGLVFGGGNNLIRETAEVFVENAEKGAARDATMRSDALAQFATEFSLQQRGLFDRFMDALNRIPRPAMALGTLGLFSAAMVDPIWFASRMQGIALVPEPLWWLLGAIVSFYFGARHQLKNQQFQQHVASSLAMAPKVMYNLKALNAMNPADDLVPTLKSAPVFSARSLAKYPNNAALRDWAQSQT